MADKTAIEWTDATFNPVGGCSVVSPGCKNCYAMKIAGSGRLRNHPLYAGTTDETKTGPIFNGRMTALPFDHPTWTWPLRWRGAKAPKLGPGMPSMIFVDDMNDLFHESRPRKIIDRHFAVFALAPQHILQVLTKRPERLRAYINDPDTPRRVYDLVCDMAVSLRLPVILISDPSHEAVAPPGRRIRLGVWPLPNLWIGTTAEDQARANLRVPELLNTQAAVRFVSHEPALGPVDWTRICLVPSTRDRAGIHVDALAGRYCESGQVYKGDWDIRKPPPPDTERRRLHQIIFGGESGPGARPAHPDWERRDREQCADAGVAYFRKQWGDWAPVSAMTGPQIEACYAPLTPRQAAMERRKRQIVESRIILPNGQATTTFPPGAMTMFRIGKKRAGALINGQLHREFPAIGGAA